jgi:ABC-type Fe3+ transport system permease subunit
MQLLFSITWGTVSGWWAPVCLALGLLYAWVLYRQPVNLADKFRYWLSAFRAIVVTVIALLLVSPLIKSVNYNPQKPLVLVLQDNSESIKMFSPKGRG